MPWAINICDLGAYQSDHEYKIMVDYMLLPVLSDVIIDCEPGRIDGLAMAVKSHVGESQMKAILDLVRNGLGKRKGVHKNLLRIYKTGKGGWKRV